MEGRGVKKAISIAILVILVFLVVACFKLQMQLNELREQCEALEEQARDARIEVERREEMLEKQENDPEGFLQDKAYEQGYRLPSDKEYVNDMPKN